MSGSSENQKFWIGIASAFVIPTVLFVYSQGMTEQSINELTKSVDKFQVNIDATNSRLSDTSRLASNNDAAINNLTKQFDKMEAELHEQNKRIHDLEMSKNRGR